jgi:hypothetical protein
MDAETKVKEKQCEQDAPRKTSTIGKKKKKSRRRKVYNSAKKIFKKKKQPLFYNRDTYMQNNWTRQFNPSNSIT